MSKKQKNKNKIEEQAEAGAPAEGGEALQDSAQEGDEDAAEPEDGEANDEAPQNEPEAGEAAPDVALIDEEEQAKIDELVFEVMEFFKAENVSFTAGDDSALTVLSLLDADGQEIEAGTLHELLEKVKAAQEGEAPPPAAAPDDQPAASVILAKHEKNLKKMKIRWIPFDRRKVLRFMKDFETEKKTYKAGDVFDWIGEGFKSYYVGRLYNRRVVRHVVEDSRVSYPFRPLRFEQPPGPAPEVDAQESGAPDEAASGKTEAPSPAKATQGATFTKKNAGRTQ